MFGLMQDHPLMISGIIRHAARHHAANEIVSRGTDGAIHRMGYADLERRARRLARALQNLDVRTGDRVATLAWNGHRHVELYYAVSGSGAICHTVNPRLSVDDVAYIIGNAGDVALFADISFAPLLNALAPHLPASLRAVVLLCERADLPELSLPPGVALLAYEDLMAGADENYDWPVFDERTAASLCYTSGTTGRPKGVLYSHRSTLLHAYASSSASVFGPRPHDRVMPVVPMFHVNAWGLPYTVILAGATLVMPGRHLDGASLASLMNAERVTMSAGVPTVWLAPAASPAHQRRAAGDGAPADHRGLHLPAGADRCVRPRVRGGRGARLGHERVQPARHLQHSRWSPGCGRDRGRLIDAARPAGPCAVRPGYPDHR